MNNIENKYALIGSFVYHFEFVVARIRSGCAFILGRGDTLQNRGIAIVFSQKLWSAEPLISVFESLVNDGLKDNPNNETKALLIRFTKFRNEFTKMVEFRNQLLHGEHLYDESVGMLIIKNAQSRKGFEVRTIVENEEDLKEKIKKLHELAEESLQLTIKLTTIIKL